MTEPAVSGQTATPGVYRCVACSAELELDHITNLPVCPHCQAEAWEPVDGGVNVYGHPEQRKHG